MNLKTTHETRDEIKERIILMIIKFPIDYIKNIFLTGSVIFSVFVLISMLISVKPDFSFGFLSYFSFINPEYGTGTFSLEIKEIMQIFLIASFVITIFWDVILIILKKLFNLETKLTLGKKIIIFLSIITLSYVFASIAAILN